MTLATRIRKTRERADLTQSEAARRAGLRRQEWYRLESGGREDPRLSTVRAVAAALGVTVGELLGERS